MRTEAEIREAWELLKRAALHPTNGFRLDGPTRLVVEAMCATLRWSLNLSLNAPNNGNMVTSFSGLLEHLRSVDPDKTQGGQ